MNIFHVILISYIICYIYASEENMSGLSKQETSLLSVKMVDPIASNPKGMSFREAVQKGDMEFAKYVFDFGSDKLKKDCGKYLAGLESSTLVGLVNGADGDNKMWMLQVLFVYADLSLIDKVFDALNLSNVFVRDIACSVDLTCIPQRFTYFLGKIDDRQEQEWTVIIGVTALFDGNRTECFDPFIAALNEGTFLNKDLGNIAILRAFNAAPFHQVDRTFLAKRFFDFPAIPAKYYSGALYASYHHGDQAKELFYWLLARADRQDLKAVKSDKKFSTRQLEFRQAVDQALQTVGSETRIGTTHRKGIPAIKEALEDDIPKDLLNIINGYYLDW